MCSQPVSVERGLCQCCPLSPLLFMLILSDLEAELAKRTYGFDWTSMEQGRRIQQRLPGLMNAHDTVLTADSFGTAATPARLLQAGRAIEAGVQCTEVCNTSLGQHRLTTR